MLEFPLRTLRYYLPLYARLLMVVFCALLLASCENKPAVVAGDPARGQPVFQSACAVCHSVAPGVKKVGPSLAGLSHMQSLPNGFSMTDANLEQWIRNGGGLMPGFKNALSPEQMRDLIAYLKTL
jgi:mono/diheme cytochrome c family protein